MIARKREALVVSKPKPPEYELVEWHGQQIIKSHCFDIAVDEIVSLAKNSDSLRIGLVGQSHAGKTTMFDALAHALREKMQQKQHLEFAIKKFTKEELINFKDTVEALPNANLILLFDDVSFLTNTLSKKQMDLIKQAITEIRHLSGRADKKIMSFFNSHYSLAVDKFIRNYDFQFQLTAGNAEYENLERAFGVTNGGIIRAFDKHRRAAMKSSGYYDVKKHGKLIHRYKWRDPFITSLFWNGDTLRLIASPTHKFLNPNCKCIKEGSTIKTEQDLQEIVAYLQKAYPRQATQCIKPILFARGQTDVYSATARKVQKTILGKNLSTEDLRKVYDKLKEDMKENRLDAAATRMEAMGVTPYVSNPDRRAAEAAAKEAAEDAEKEAEEARDDL